MVFVRSGDHYRHKHISASRDTTCRMQTDRYIRIPPVVYPVSNRGGYLHCSHGLNSSYCLSQLIITLTQLPPARRTGDQSGLVVDGKQLWLASVCCIINSESHKHIRIARRH